MTLGRMRFQSWRGGRARGSCGGQGGHCQPSLHASASTVLAMATSVALSSSTALPARALTSAQDNGTTSSAAAGGWLCAHVVSCNLSSTSTEGNYMASKVYPIEWVAPCTLRLYQVLFKGYLTRTASCHTAEVGVRRHRRLLKAQMYTFCDAGDFLCRLTACSQPVWHPSAACMQCTILSTDKCKRLCPVRCNCESRAVRLSIAHIY